MFVLLQMPFVDLRGLQKDALGRCRQPDWRSDDPGLCFIRNFGGMMTRNAKSYGLVGERAYVEFEHALAFPHEGRHSQDGWSHPLPLPLWFRRLYFDGDISGRFEVGFKLSGEFLKSVGAVCDLSLLARSICDIPVEVRSPDGTRTQSSLEHCGQTLGLSYLVATTLHSKRNEHLASEMIGKHLKVGAPAVYIRATADTPITIPEDRGDIANSEGDHFFLTSIAKAQRRNTLMVQISNPRWSEKEPPQQRARRVLFSHLNSVLHANDFLSGAMDTKAIAAHRVSLKQLTARAIDRFSKLNMTGPETRGDDGVADALKLFAYENAGRIDEVVEKLEKLAKDASAPSRIERVGAWVKGWSEFVTETTIKAAIDRMMPPGS